MIQKISSALRGAKRFFLTSHLNPDGDAVGSLLAFQCLLRENGCETTAWMADPIPQNFMFLPGADTIIHSREKLRGRSFDVAVVVDSTDWERTGMLDDPEIMDSIDCGTIINIDHHNSNSNFGDINLVDIGASAVGELIFDIITEMGGAISIDVATCIYTAIMTDTGNFTYSNTTARSYEISGKLVALGVCPDRIAEEVNENYPVSRLDLLKMALTTIEFSDDMTIGAMTISQKMFQDTETGPDIIEGFIDYPRYVAGVKVAVLFRDLSNGAYKVSFRSRDNFDVSAIARHFGGGGHTNASGCTIEGKLLDIKKEVFAIVKKAIGEGMIRAS
jgi:phosphoesterase RecJ-like protein